METPISAIKSLFERIEVYIKTTLELSKLKFLEKISLVLTSLISKIFVVITIFMFLLILSIGAALFLGELLGKIYYGFFIVAGFYLFIGIILHLFLHKWIKNSVCNSIIKRTLQ